MDRTTWALLTYLPLTPQWRSRRRTIRLSNRIMDAFEQAFPSQGLLHWDTWPRDPFDLHAIWELHVAALQTLEAIARGATQEGAMATLEEHWPDYPTR